MLKYAIMRSIQGVLLIFVVTIMAFLFLYMMPGDPVEVLGGERLSEEMKQELREEYGLNDPLPIQYLNWMKGILSGDFGNSIITKLPVADTLVQRIPITLTISGLTELLVLAVGIPLGLLSAYKKDSIFDRILMGLASFFQSIPNFWLAILLILLFSVGLQWLPLNGYSTPLHYILPILSGALVYIPLTMRMVKVEVLEVYREKFVLTAYAKGLAHRKVMTKHVLRNSLIMVVVMTFMNIPWIISGSVILENIFVIPGMGSYLTNGIATQDFAVVQACVLIICTLTVICNILGDILIAFLDPRVRIEITKEN